jgi:hypothetical protein
MEEAHDGYAEISFSQLFFHMQQLVSSLICNLQKSLGTFQKLEESM